MQVNESRDKFTGTMTSRSLSPNPYRGQFVICLTPSLVYTLHSNTQYLYILNIFLHTFTCCMQQITYLCIRFH